MFLKAPVPGEVKTRLAAELGPDEACREYEAMAREVYRTAQEVTSAGVRVFYAPHPKRPDIGWLDEARARDFTPQSGKDLGARLIHAFETVFRDGATRAVAIGSDSPGMHPEWVSKAFDSLGHCDVALGPAEDGGYYLIGLSKPRPELFQGIPWSDPDTLKETLHRIEGLGLMVHILPRHYDIDDLETLKRWKAAKR